MSTDVVSARGYLADLLAAQAQPPASAASPTPAWLKALRAEATERVGVLRMPTPHDESWRFADISSLTRQSFSPLRTPISLRAGDIERFHIDEATTRLVFVDGVHAPHLSLIGARVGAAAAGDAALVVGNLTSTMATHGPTLQANLGRHAAFHDRPFAALNTPSCTTPR